MSEGSDERILLNEKLASRYREIHSAGVAAERAMRAAMKHFQAEIAEKQQLLELLWQDVAKEHEIDIYDPIRVMTVVRNEDGTEDVEVSISPKYGRNHLNDLREDLGY